VGGGLAQRLRLRKDLFQGLKGGVLSFIKKRACIEVYIMGRTVKANIDLENLERL